MSDIKMSEVFNLPVETDLGFACIRDGEITDIANFDVSEEGIERTKSAVHAINNHDKLTSRVAELEAALQSVIHKSYDNNETKQTIELFARNALKEGE